MFRNYYITFIGMFFTYIYYIIDSSFPTPDTLEQIKNTQHKEYVERIKKHLDKVHKT